MDIKVFNALGNEGVNGVTKSAIIYRDESARFIYVCFHCGSMFNEIHTTLQHIESHFRLANVMVDQTTTIQSQLTVDGNEMKDKLAMSPTPDNFDIKTELADEFDDIHPALTVVPIIHAMDSEDDKPKPVKRKARDTTQVQRRRKLEKPRPKLMRVEKR